MCQLLKAGTHFPELPSCIWQTHPDEMSLWGPGEQKWSKVTSCKVTLLGVAYHCSPFPKFSLSSSRSRTKSAYLAIKLNMTWPPSPSSFFRTLSPSRSALIRTLKGFVSSFWDSGLPWISPTFFSSLSNRLSCQCHSSVLLPRTVASQTVLKQLCQLCKSSPCNRIQVHSPSLLLPVRQGSTLHVLSSASVIEPWVTDTGASGSDLTMHIEAGTLPVLRCCRPCFWALKTFSAMSVTLILFQPQDKRNMRCNRVGDSTGGNDFFQFTELAQREQRETVRFTSWFFCSLHAVWCWAGYLPSLGLLSHLFKSIILASTSQGLWRLNELTCAKYLEQCKVYISVCGYYHYFIIGEGMS